MFYSEVILARKGPLGKIWLAAHFDKKLTKKQIFSTDISSSVESVLNPANPLALRVSGHLMLGIVRIYSRKMKYLVTDCADAMWKIDLAFRPKNVDIDPTIAQIIDDARHFGNVSIDNEFPELENTAFPQDLLSGYDYSRLDGGRFSDSSFGNDGGFNDYSFNAESPLFSKKSARTGSSSRRSEASDIELTREQRGLSLGSQQHQQRLSLGVSRPSQGMSIGGGIEDDIPAFTDLDDAFAYGAGESSAGGQLLEFGTQDQPLDEPPPFDNDYYYPDDEMKNPQEEGVEKSGRESLRVRAAKQKEAEAAEQEDEDEEGSRAGAKTDGAIGTANAASARRKKKKRVMIDDRVELPSRLIKQRRTDLAPILRQRGTDALQQQLLEDPDTYAATRAQRNHLLRSSPLGHRVHIPAGVRGMCAELQEVFGMSINAAPLPFPLKDGAVATPQPAVELDKRGPSSSGALNHTVESIEHMRAPRDSELSVAGRASLLHSRDDGRLSVSKSADASFVDGGGTEGGYTYDAGGDFYAEPYGDAQTQLMDFGGDGEEMGVEEVKRSDSAEKVSLTSRKDRDSFLPVARNAVSELVTSTFSKGASELASSGAGDFSGGSKSSGSSRHTRTEQFMGILEDEFQSAEDSVVSFDNLSAGVSKRVAAACFLEVLQLKTWGRIRATQEAPFEDILLRPSTSSPLLAGSM